MRAQILSVVGATLASALAFSSPTAALTPGNEAPQASSTSPGVQTPAKAATSTAATSLDGILTTATYTYRIGSSCKGYEDEIRDGAAYWTGMFDESTDSSATPVNCRTDIFVCGQTKRANGCNEGKGQRITLSTKTFDFALLAAHEFGHNMYKHSDHDCRSWDSDAAVMAPIDKECSN
ncbi:hypothetical protein [Streptomyces sp. f51]|uniref:hypothetical protein n=1 Tax=Streptomyces sp. f51 TaxID=1827742 RepID=UPI000BEFC69B|nr:hypothetical protein [Streptomyces sp. f51]